MLGVLDQNLLGGLLVIPMLFGVGGALHRGMLLGVAESSSAFVIDGQYRSLMGLVMFLIVSSARPQGLFGCRRPPA